MTPMVEQACGQLQQNAIAQARQLCLDVRELAPGHPDALSLLYQICRDQGPPTAAEAFDAGASWAFTGNNSRSRC